MVSKPCWLHQNGILKGDMPISASRVLKVQKPLLKYVKIVLIIFVHTIISSNDG